MMNQETKEWMIVAKQNHLNKLNKLHDVLITEIAVLDKELQDLNKTESDDLVMQKLNVIYKTTGDNEEMYSFEETIYLIDKERFTKYSNSGYELKSLNVHIIRNGNWITFKSKEEANEHIIRNGNWLSFCEILNLKEGNVNQLQQITLANADLYTYIKDKLTKENKLYL